MKILKTLLLSVAGLIGALLLIAIFLPSDYRVERSIEISRPVPVVFDQVADFNHWPAWNPWTAMEPTARTVVSGAPRMVGSSWAWEGEKLGRGSLTIREIIPNQAIRSTLRFLEPQQMEARDSWTFLPANNGTRVIWANEGKLSYPMERYLGLFMDGMLGSDYEKGLAKLKQVAEK